MSFKVKINISNQKKNPKANIAWVTIKITFMMILSYYSIENNEEFPDVKDHTNFTTSLSFDNIGHIGYISPTYFSHNSFIYETLCSLTFVHIQ